MGSIKYNNLLKMNFLSKIWLRSTFLFDPIQTIFNGHFWEVFKRRFGYLGSGWVVDLGCGTGELIRYIEPKGYLGVDINPNYIRMDKKRFGQADTEFLLGDITQFIPEKKYETVFVISAFHHLSDSQIEKMCRSLGKSKTKTLIVVDGYPVGFPKKILAWLDATLGGGKYFRDEGEIARIVARYFKVRKKGSFSARLSFYRYPYIIATR